MWIRGTILSFKQVHHGVEFCIFIYTVFLPAGQTSEAVTNMGERRAKLRDVDAERCTRSEVVDVRKPLLVVGDVKPKRSWWERSSCSICCDEA